MSKGRVWLRASQKITPPLSRSVYSKPEDAFESNYSNWVTAAVRAYEAFVTGSKDFTSLSP